MSSSTSNTNSASANADATTTRTSTTIASSRRRSSAASSSQLFAGLHGQKRTSLDASAAARKASFAEQAHPAGFLGGLWNSFTKGGTAPGGGGK